MVSEGKYTLVKHSAFGDWSDQRVQVYATREEAQAEAARLNEPLPTFSRYFYKVLPSQAKKGVKNV